MATSINPCNIPAAYAVFYQLHDPLRSPLQADIAAAVDLRLIRQPKNPGKTALKK